MTHAQLLLHYITYIWQVTFVVSTYVHSWHQLSDWLDTALTCRFPSSVYLKCITTDHHLFCSGTLQNAQVQHGDLLMVMQRLSLQHVPVPQLQRPQQQPQALTRDGSLQNPQAFLHAALNNPAMLSQYPPAVRDAVSSGDIEAVQFTLRQMHEADRMEAELIRPGEDPMDPAVQVHKPTRRTCFLRISQLVLVGTAPQSL